MKLIPAIDLRDGGVVRLRQGDFAHSRRFEVSPLSLAQRYVDAGARWLHLVDLDGARAGRPVHTALLEDLGRLPVRIQWGGGVRSRADIDALLAGGAVRVVVGSVAARAPALFAQWLQELGPEHLCLALDLRPNDGGWQIAVDAWQVSSPTQVEALLDEVVAAGLRHVLSTDISRDGLAQGPSLELYRWLAARWPMLSWIASGGVRNEGDLQALADTGVDACVAGTALLDGTLPLSAIAAVSGTAD